MELQQLKYFKTVAQIGKISEAAEALFISAPALSTSIARLEKELGSQLFDRTNNRIILNHQGQIFLRYVNQVFNTLDYAKNELRQSLILQGHHVSFACVSTSQWTDLITAFSQEHPQYTLSCTSVKSTELTNNGLPIQHNFLLTSENSLPDFLASELDSIALFEDEPIIAVHPDHPLACKEQVLLSELLDSTLIFPMQNYSLYEHLESLFHAEDIPVPASNAYSYMAGLQLAAQGFGIAFVYRHATHNLGFNLRYIPIRTTCQPRTFRLYWRKNHVLSQDEQLFKSFVEAFYQG